MEYLKTAIDHISPISDFAWSEIAKATSVKKLNKGDNFLRVGENACNICFIKTGILREFYVDINGKETTRRFCKPNEFSGSLADLISNQPSITTITAIIPCELIITSFAAIDELSERDISIMKLLRRIAEWHYIRKSAREHEMLSLNAKARFERFSQQEPFLISAVPRQLIASYLGITQVHLSRLSAREKSRQLQLGKK